TLVDAVILVSIFIAYTLRISRAPQTEPDLIGPAAWVGAMGKRARRASVLSMFAVAGVVILLVAEHFAESLVETGTELGVSEFLLVQWLGPLASEAPELVVVALYAWRLKTSEALTAVVSSKINQWTLLVGTLPLVFAIASGSLSGLPVEAAQREELLLTAAQTVFAVALLVNLCISLREAFALFGLFWAQFVLGAVVPPSPRGVAAFPQARRLPAPAPRRLPHPLQRAGAAGGRRGPVAVSGHEVEGQREHGVHGQQLEALEPGRLALLGDLVGDDDGQEDGPDLEAVEHQRHRERPDHERRQDQHRGHEQGDLGRGTDGDVDRQVHLVAQGEVDGDPVLGGVADDGDHDDADEERRQAQVLRGLGDGPDQDLRHHPDGHPGDGQHGHRPPDRPGLADV